MTTARRSCATIVLAAGRGTRMRSERPKVLHEIAGRPMLGHVLDAARGAGTDTVAVVVGHGADEVRAMLADEPGEIATFEQSEQLGTAHATLAARAAIERGYDDLLVVFGDTPMLTGDTLAAVRSTLAASGAAVVVVGFDAPPPNGYGRLIEQDNALVAIREARDASDDELAIRRCNGGIMGLNGRVALNLLDAIGNDNAKGEFYLTDVVQLAVERSLTCRVHMADGDEVLGVNDRVELAEAEALWQTRARRELLRSGVTMAAPHTVHLHHDTRVAPDATIEPFVVFGPGVEVASKAVVRSFSHLEGASVGEGAVVGPSARLRPGTVLGTNSKVGNFCEVKKAEVGEGAKINHLTYVGDAIVGASANVGAGTITCNYDGVGKHVTTIGENAFIGSNSALVAPITVGAGAYVASGSVLTKDVADDALAFGRARQSVKENGGALIRERARARKNAPSNE